MGDMNNAICSCGESKVHVIARRRTADGIAVCLFSDGAVAGNFHALQGVPVARPRTAEAQQQALAAGWMLVGEVCLYDLDEVGALYDACRWAAKRGLDRQAMLARLHAEAEPPIAWTITATDSRGNTTEREGRLNRLQWPGVVVLHSSRGYEVLYEQSAHMLAKGSDRRVLATSGVRFSSQRDLFAHLRSIAVRMAS